MGNGMLMMVVEMLMMKIKKFIKWTLHLIHHYISVYIAIQSKSPDVRRTITFILTYS